MTVRTAQPATRVGPNSLYPATFLWNAADPDNNAVGNVASVAGLKGTDNTGTDGKYRKFGADGIMEFVATLPTSGAYTLVVVLCYPTASVTAAKLVAMDGTGGVRIEPMSTGGGAYQNLIHTTAGGAAAIYSTTATFNTAAWVYIAAASAGNVRQYQKTNAGVSDSKASTALAYTNATGTKVQLGDSGSLPTQGLYAVMLIPSDIGDAECLALQANPWKMFADIPATDTVPPTVTAAAVANATPTIVNLTMSEAMDTGSVPAASAFTVSGHTVSSVAITGSTINLTCSAAFVYGESARTVSYTQPGTNNAKDAAGNLLANFSAQVITNSVAATDLTAPTFSSAQVANAARSDIVITMSETLAAFTPATAAFTVSGGKTVSSVARSGSTITLTVNSAYAYGDTITATYTKPGTNQLRDAAGNESTSFGPSAVTNNIASSTAGQFVTKKLGNNTASGWPAGTAVYWEWCQGWRIGAAATSRTYGTGTLASDGTLTMTGLPAGAGSCMVAVRGVTYDLDQPYLQSGVVS